MAPWRWHSFVFLLALTLAAPAALWPKDAHVHLGESEGGHWWVATPHCSWHRAKLIEAPILTADPGHIHLESGCSRYCSSRDLEPASDLPGSPLTPRTLTEAPNGPMVPDTAGLWPDSMGVAWPLAPPGENSLLPLRI